MRLSTEAVSVTERIRESGGVKSRDEEGKQICFRSECAETRLLFSFFLKKPDRDVMFLVEIV